MIIVHRFGRVRTCVGPDPPGVDCVSPAAVLAGVSGRRYRGPHGTASGIAIVISVPGDVARTSNRPPDANALARIDDRPM